MELQDQLAERAKSEILESTSELVEEALRVIRDLMRNARSENVRLTAAENYVDRFGQPKKSARDFSCQSWKDKIKADIDKTQAIKELIDSTKAEVEQKLRQGGECRPTRPSWTLCAIF
jgi:hypothetical protein